MRSSHPKVFLSYAHHDSDFAYKLQVDLENRGADVWIDVKRIFVGESISESVEKALERMDFFCIILSRNSVRRKWVQREYRAALTLQLSRNGKKPSRLLKNSSFEHF
jgi:predicted nucleotide-binding protein